MEQESQKRKLDDGSCNSATAPILCANNCGFFASASTNNLCSKCYKEFLAQQTKVSDDNVLGKEIAEVKHWQVVEGGTTSENPDKISTANRCGFCRKRVGLTGFKCKCGQTFCSSHRYSDKHNCMFDYKSAGQDAIAKANPVVKADKIEKI